MGTYLAIFENPITGFIVANSSIQWWLLCLLDWSVLWLTGEFGNLEHIHGCQDLSDDLQKHVRIGQKLSEPIRICQKLSKLSGAIKNYQKLSEAIRNYQKLSEAIKSYQKPSESIKIYQGYK